MAVKFQGGRAVPQSDVQSLRQTQNGLKDADQALQMALGGIKRGGYGGGTWEQTVLRLKRDIDALLNQVQSTIAKG